MLQRIVSLGHNSGLVAAKMATYCSCKPVLIYLQQRKGSACFTTSQVATLGSSHEQWELSAVQITTSPDDGNLLCISVVNDKGSIYVELAHVQVKTPQHCLPAGAPIGRLGDESNLSTRGK